jgi:hypothetical protein
VPIRHRLIIPYFGAWNEFMSGFCQRYERLLSRL